MVDLCETEIKHNRTVTVHETIVHAFNNQLSVGSIFGSAFVCSATNVC